MRRANKVAEQEWPAEGFDHRAGTNVILKTAVELVEGKPIMAVGHRVVHGGTNYAAPIRIDPGVVAALAELVPLAPLHQPHNLSPIRTISEVAPHIPQVACFDTAFHRRQPDIAQLFAIPRKFTEAGVRRLRLSRPVLRICLGPALPGRARADRCPHRDLPSRQRRQHVRGPERPEHGEHDGTSTAVDGLMMGTRCGAIDPGVLLYLMDSHGMDARAIEDLVYKQSGLLGVSGFRPMCAACASRPSPPPPRHSPCSPIGSCREVGSLAAALGGLDALVFHTAASARTTSCSGLKWPRAAPGSAWRSIRPSTMPARGASVPTVPAFRSGSLRPTRSSMIARHTTSLLGLGSVSSTAAAAAPVTA
jgi:acetate kinase